MFGSNRAYDRLSARNVELARQVRELNEENKTLYRENKKLRFENEELRDTSLNAEKRALIHFGKLQAIEKILNQDEKTREFAVFTVNKIKEVITSDQTKQ